LAIAIESIPVPQPTSIIVNGLIRLFLRT